MTRDIATDVAAILHPLPEPSPEEYADSPEVYDTWREGIAEKQQRLAEQLRSDAEGSEGDPLLIALQNELVAKQKAEANIRRLLAYGREFVRPRGYTLESLAKAAGMSISGVRTAYLPVDVETVAKATGTKPRDGRAPEPTPGEPDGRPDRTYSYMGDPIPDRTIVNYMGDRVQVVDDRNPVDILAAADDFLTGNPGASETDVATELGITASRLRKLRQVEQVTAHTDTTA